MDLRTYIRTIPDWPQPGIMFRDITTLLQDPGAFRYAVDALAYQYRHQPISKIMGIESRGFIIAAALAYELHLPLVLARKHGKLPAETIAQEYQLEYGTDTLEVHKDALLAGETVLIIDDLLATGGTALAACQLVEKSGAAVSGVAVIINLPDLHGAEKLKRYNPFYLVEFEGE